MRYLTLFAVDLTLLMLATLVAFALRENFEFAESRFEALLPYLGATVLMATILVPVPASTSRFGNSAVSTTMYASAAL